MKTNRLENCEVTGVVINIQNTTIFEHAISIGFYINIYIKFHVFVEVSMIILFIVQYFVQKFRTSLGSIC